MVVSFVGQGTQQEVTPASGNILTLPYPASGIQDNDCAVAIGSWTNAAVPAAQAGNGWTDLVRHSSSGDTLQPALYIGVRECDGTENGGNGVLTVPNNNAIGVIGVFRDVDIPNVTALFSETASGADTVLTGLTAVDGAALLYAVTKNSTATDVPTPPAGFVEIMDRAIGLRSASAAYDLGVGAGPTGAINVTWGVAARSNGALVHLPPAAVGGFSRRALNVYTGSANVRRPTKVFDGTNWVPRPINVSA